MQFSIIECLLCAAIFILRVTPTAKTFIVAARTNPFLGKFIVSPFKLASLLINIRRNSEAAGLLRLDVRMSRRNYILYHKIQIYQGNTISQLLPTMILLHIPPFTYTRNDLVYYNTVNTCGAANCRNRHLHSETCLSITHRTVSKNHLLPLRMENLKIILESCSSNGGGAGSSRVL